MIRVFLLVLGIQLLAACATGKSVTSAENINDDGKSNIVAFTYDVTLQSTEKYATVKSTSLNFRCPETSSGNSGVANNCFSLKVPYNGRANRDGYSTHEFQSSGSKVMRMKYGQYNLTSARHSVVVDRIPDVYCYYNKRQKRNVCNRRMKDEKITHTANFPDTVDFAVSGGSGCYLGHLSMLMENGNIEEYDFERSDSLTPERIESFDENLRDSIASHVAGSC